MFPTVLVERGYAFVWIAEHLRRRADVSVPANGATSLALRGYRRRGRRMSDPPTAFGFANIAGFIARNSPMTMSI